jgi:PAS domain S-box-containing protein
MHRHLLQPLAIPCWLPLLAGIFASSCGTLVLFGWLSNTPLLITGLPDLPPTHPLAALWLLLMGCTLVLLRLRSYQLWARRSAVLLIGFTLLTATLTLSSAVFGWPAPNRFFVQLLPSPSAALPAYPALQTAISVCCLCIALVRRAVHPQAADGAAALPLLLMFPILVPILALIGQFYHLLVASASALLIVMSLPIALGLLVVSSGTIALYPDSQLMRLVCSPGQDGVLARRLLPVSLGAPLFFAMSASLGQRLGWYGAQGTLAVVTLALIVVFLFVNWWSVTTIRSMDRQRMRAAERLHRLSSQRQRLLEVAQLLITTPAVDAILSRVQHSLAAVIAFDGFGLYWLDAPNALLQPAKVVQPPHGDIAIPPLPLPLDRGIAASVIQTGQGEVVKNAHHDPRSFYPPGSAVTHEHLICLPLQAHDQTLGVFLMSRHADPPFSDDEFELVQLFIGYASLALSNARLFEQATRTAEHTRALLHISERQARELALMGEVRAALARELELPVLFRTVVEAIATTFGYTHVSLYTLAADGLHLQHQVGYEQVIPHVPLTSGVSGRVVRTRQPVLLEDVRDDPAFLGATAGILSEVCVPLFDNDQVVGTLNVESTHGVRLSEAELRLMVGLSEHIGIAIGRARLYTAIRESETQFATIFRASPVAICITILADGRYVDANPSFLRMMEYAREELIGQSAEALAVWATPTDQARITRTIQQQRSIDSMELTLRAKSGTPREVLCSMELIDRDDRWCVLSMSQDLTQQKLAATEREQLIAELREALANIRTLRGLLPICASCKKIRDDHGYWNQLESYIHQHTGVAFSHGICPDCIRRLYPDIAEDLNGSG